ncbi:hypothetical protein L593_06860 [Salinarchaeum sp. Harcht-Bsk1]|nr:hypothetical protein L593_06860 [Salinarchaeum sp. Harcht-Bsk1]
MRRRRPRSWHPTGEVDGDVGEESPDGLEPANYADYALHYVPDRFAYYERGDGCLPTLAGACCVPPRPLATVVVLYLEPLTDRMGECIVPSTSTPTPPAADRVAFVVGSR